MDVLTQFQQRFELGPSLEKDKSWAIDVNGGYVVNCVAVNGNVRFYSELGPLDEAKNRELLLKELLQNITVHLTGVQETITLKGQKNTLELVRNIGKPESLLKMEQAFEDFVSSFEFFRPIYDRHT